MALFVVTSECDVLICSVALCLCVSCSGSNFESLDLETSFLICRYNISEQLSH